MKFLRLTFLLALVGGFGLMSSCNKGGDPEPSIEEKNLELMSKTWVVKSVTLAPGSEGNMTDLYQNMELTISGTFSKNITTSYNYSVTGRPDKSPWPDLGTWKFKDGVSGVSATTIVRTEDNLDMSYAVTTTQLQLVFLYEGTGYTGRTSAVSGEWTFEFEPK